MEQNAILQRGRGRRNWRDDNCARVCTHEARHSFGHWSIQHSEAFEECSCIPGPDYDGYTQSTRKNFYTTEELMARMACCYAGFVSEKMFFTHSVGEADDLQKIDTYARNFVRQRGGPGQTVQDVKDEALAMAEGALRYRKRTLEKIALRLFLKKTLYPADMRELVGRGPVTSRTGREGRRAQSIFLGVEGGMEYYALSSDGMDRVGNLIELKADDGKYAGHSVRIARSFEHPLEMAKKRCTFVQLSNLSSMPQSLFKNEGKNNGSRRDSLTADGTPAPNCSELTGSEFDEGNANRDRCEKNSLAQLYSCFLMVVLIKKNRKVSLDVTSTVLIKNPDKKDFEPPPRSKCRRLYDIANVLVAMRLIHKKHALFGTKKIPLFEYCELGPDADPAAGHLQMLEFLQRSGLTKIVAESVKAAGEERELSDRKKENGSRKRKRPFTAEINQTSVKKEADDPMENSTEAINAKKAKCEEMNKKLSPMGVTIRQKTEGGQLRRPKPMMPPPPPFPTGGCFEVGGPSPAQQSSAIHAILLSSEASSTKPAHLASSDGTDLDSDRPTTGSQPFHLVPFPSQNFDRQLLPVAFTTFFAAPFAKTQCRPSVKSAPFRSVHFGRFSKRKYWQNVFRGATKSEHAQKETPATDLQKLLDRFRTLSPHHCPNHSME